jgi:hypothetical protein
VEVYRSCLAEEREKAHTIVKAYYCLHNKNNNEYVLSASRHYRKNKFKMFIFFSCALNATFTLIRAPSRECTQRFCSHHGSMRIKDFS